MKFRIVKPRTAIMVLLFFGAMVILPVLFFVMGELGYGFIFLAVWLASFGILVEQCLVKRIEIRESGVRYITLFKSYEMSWEKIKIVGIGYVPMKMPGRKPWIYFAADGISMPMLFANMVGSEFFMVSYCKKVEDAIRMYWTENIDGLDDISDFEKRSDTKRRLT